MTMRTASALFSAALMLALAPSAHSAQPGATVWRCGADGRQFSDQPCAEGRSLDALAARPAADVADAQRRAERERRLAAETAAARAAQESTVAQGPANLGPSRAVKSPEKEPRRKSRQRHHRSADDDTLRAIAPASRRARG